MDRTGSNDWKMTLASSGSLAMIGSDYMSPAAFAASCVEPDSATLRQSQHSDVLPNPLTEAGT